MTPVTSTTFPASNPANKALWDNIVAGNCESAEQAIAQGADPNFRTGAISPIHLAVITGRPEMVELLVRRGAELDAPDEIAGRTALHWAAIGSTVADPKLLERLIALRPALNAPDRDGFTALDLAMGAVNEPAIQCLENAGAQCRPDRSTWVARELEQEQRVRDTGKKGP